MGAVPKNKITSAERGKRRHGNRPSLKKNLAQAQVPLHKKGLVAQIFQTIGLTSPVAAPKVKKPQTGQKQKKKSAQAKTAKTKPKTKKTPKKSAKTQTKPAQTSSKASPEIQPSKQREAQVKTNKPSKQRAQDRG